jgi:hypothetical protein
MPAMEMAQNRADALKSQFAAVFEEVGLDVSHARSVPMAAEPGWFVGAFASLPDWNQPEPMVILAATVSADGQWPRIVHIWSGLRTEDGRRMMLNGREQVRLHDLVGELMQTLEEFQYVQSAIAAGTPGPHWFGKSLWLEQ